MKHTLDTMSDDEFDSFCDSLPPRVRMLAQGRMVSWQRVIDEYYQKPLPEIELTSEDIPF